MGKSKPKGTTPPDEVRHLSVYDGRDFVGSVTGAGKRWIALDPNGRALRGTFKSAKAATGALNTALTGSCSGDPSARMDGSG